LEFHGYLREGPKHDPDEFYGYDEELGRVADSMTHGGRRIVEVLGLRRVGKTSLVLTAFVTAMRSGAVEPSKAVLIHADFRGITGRSSALHTILNGCKAAERVVGRTKAASRLMEAIGRRLAAEERVTKKLSINAIIVRGGVSRTLVRRLSREGVLEGFRDVLELIDDACGEEGLRCVVFLDELHEVLGRVRGARSEVPQALAYAYDSLTNLRIIVSGSRIRLTESIIQSEELVQRTEQVLMRPLSREESWDLLRRSFRDHGVEFAETALERGYEVSMGVAGWLTDYGRRYVRAYMAYGDPLKALRDAVSRTLDVMRLACSEELAELKRRLKGGETYAATYRVLEYVAKGVDRFSGLKRVTGLSDGMLNHVLEILLKYDLLVKEPAGERGVRYAICDPAVLAHFRSIGIK